jgi:hypothetical protein
MRPDPSRIAALCQWPRRFAKALLGLRNSNRYYWLNCLTKGRDLGIILLGRLGLLSSFKLWHYSGLCFPVLSRRNKWRADGLAVSIRHSGGGAAPSASIAIITGHAVNLNKKKNIISLTLEAL